MREMKDSGIVWIGKIPDKWQINRLKNNVQCHFGGCWGEEPKGDENDRLCIRIADFNYANQSVKNEASTYRNYTESQLSKCTLKNHDLILEKSGGGDKTPVGRVVIYSYEHHPEALFANFSECLRLNDISYYKFVAYHLKALYYNFDMSYYFHQTTGIQNIDLPAYLNIILCTPNKEEQQKIAAYLDTQCSKIDTLIANQQSQIEKLKSYKQSLITEVVTKGLDKNVPMKDSGVEWIGEIPEHWKVIRIQHLYEERNEKGNENLPLLTVSINSGVSDRELDDSESARTFIRSEDKSKYKRVYPSDLTYNMMRAWQGAFGAVRVEGMVSPAYVVAKPKVELDSRFMEALLRTPLANQEMQRHSHGIMDFRLRLYWYEFKTITVCLPSVKEQTKIADYIDYKLKQIDTLISLKQQKIEKLQQYKKSLIYEYVTGKKEVE